MPTAQASTLDMNKLNAFIDQFVTDLGASVHAGIVVIGEKLGFYKAFAHEPVKSAELAQKTGIASFFPSPGNLNLRKETGMPEYVIERDIHRVGDRSLSSRD